MLKTCLLRSKGKTREKIDYTLSVALSTKYKIQNTKYKIKNNKYTLMYTYYFLQHNNVSPADLLARISQGNDAISVSKFAEFLKQKVDKKAELL